MTLTALYAGSPDERDAWAAALDAAGRAQNIDFALELDVDEVPADQVDILLFAPTGPVPDLRAFSNLQLVQSLWAGVEKIVSRPDLPKGTPIARMVDPGMTEGMVEYVTGAVLRAHLGQDALLENRRSRIWRPVTPPLARQRRVGVMGLGELGAACASALAALNFNVLGWSRSPKTILDVQAFHSEAALDAFLSSSDILVLLLPLTPQTQGLLGDDALAKLPPGAHIINVARGPILSEAALLAALRRPDGLGGATLDVFDVEPLPESHAYWDEPRIMITPHIASATRPETAAAVVVEQIGRLQRGETLHHLVDLDSGY